jgi:hypothetical protein
MNLRRCAFHCVILTEIASNKLVADCADSTEQSSSCEAKRFSANQVIPHSLWNQKVHYRIHKCPPPVPILSHINPVPTLTSQVLKIRLNITLPSTPRSFKWSVSLRLRHQNPVYTSALPACVLHAPPYSPTVSRYMVAEIKELEDRQVSRRHSAPLSSYFGVAEKHKVFFRSREGFRMSPIAVLWHDLVPAEISLQSPSSGMHVTDQRPNGSP